MSGEVVQYASDYLDPGVKLPDGPAFHQVMLRWDLEHPDADGLLKIDPNACALDDFGDPSLCTLIAAFPQDLRLTLKKEKAGKKLYAVEIRPRRLPPASALPYQSVPLRIVLITPPRRDPLRIRLLVLKNDSTILRIIELHRA